MRNTKFKKSSAILLHTAISSVLLTQAVGVQAEESFTLEEIVVTAQKRAERLIEVPISIATVGAEAIEQTGIKELKEMGDLTPNLQISQNSDFGSRITIRGVGADSRNIGFDSRVGVYLDGIYLGQSPAANQGLVDLERVEVLRGPQGTLFGKNTVAGAINLISKKPGDEFEASLGANIGNFSNREVQASVNLPVSEDTAVKLYANKTTRDGYIKNLFNGDDVNERDSVSGRVHLRTFLSSALEMNISADYLSQDRLAFNGEPLTSTFGNAKPTDGTKKYEVSQNNNVPEDKDLWGTSVTFDYDLGNDYALKSITAYRDTEISFGTDVDYSEADILSVFYTDSYAQTTQEFQLISPDNSAFKYVLGLYLYQQEGETERAANGGDQITVFGDPRLQPGRPAVVYAGTVDTESYAVFMNGSYDLSERATLGFGFRYSEETKDVDWAIDGSNSGFFNIATGSIKDSRTDRDFAPTVSLNYALNGDNFVYGRFSTGFKSGGYNLDFVNADQFGEGIEFDEETVVSYELGYKGELLDRRLRVNLALFYSEFDDYQVNQYIDLGGGRTALAITNAAEVITQGFEAELTYQPTANFQLTAALGLLDASFDSFPAGGAGGSDAGGNELPYAPEVTGALGAQYYYPLPSLASTLLLRADYSYTDGYDLTVNNDDGHTLADGSEVAFGRLDSYDTVSARVGLIDDGDRWEVYLWGRNLTDSDHLNYSTRDFFGTILGGYAMPRTYGIEGKIKF